MAYKCDDEFRDKYRAAKVLAATGSCVKAAKAAGVPGGRVRLWQRSDWEFREMYRQIREEFHETDGAREWRLELERRDSDGVSRLSAVKESCLELYETFYWWVSSFFEPKIEHKSSEEILEYKAKLDELRHHAEDRIMEGEVNGRTDSS